jgi:hypothetical protein
MSSGKTTIDTHILRVRNLFALQPSTQAYIQPFQLPIVANEGQVQFYSTLQWLSCISVPLTGNPNNTLLNIFSTIQPGLSTFADITQSNFVSTTAGLGTALYVSTSFLDNKIARLSQDNKYISASMLYDTISWLGNLSRINETPNPISIMNNSNFPLGVGYVSTSHAGEYKTYYSTLGSLNLNNLDNQSFNTGDSFNPVNIDLGGYSSHLVPNSKFIIDVSLNLRLATPTGQTRNSQVFVSTFLTRIGENTPKGLPVVSPMAPTDSNLHLGNAKFFLTSNDVYPLGQMSLNLELRKNNLLDGPFDASTYIPTVGGIFVTLDNKD